MNDKCEICNQLLNYKYYKQTQRCFNCDFIRIPSSHGDRIV